MTQKERSSKKRRRNRFIKRMVPIVGIFLLVLAASGGGYYTYAKYFSQSARKGIVIASQVYFTANYAAEDDYNPAVQGDSKVFFEKVVNSAYNGTDYEFRFEVRNYENNLLFNESSVVIPYTLKFWTDESQVPQGATYYVKWGESNSLAIGSGEGAAAVIGEQSIAGGSAFANEYSILLDVSGNDVHTAVPIYVEVTTDVGAVVNKTLRGKMVLTTGGATAELNLESWHFTVQGIEQADLTLDDVNAMAVLTYEVSTVGESTGEGNEKIKLSWKSDFLEIDLFDESYDAWKTATGLDEPATETDAYGITWNYITIDAMPYASETICFLRGGRYDEITTLDGLNACVKAELVTN